VSKYGSTHYSVLFLVTFIASIFTIIIPTFFISLVQTVYAQPSIIDAHLNVEEFVEGLSSPTRILVISKGHNTLHDNRIA